MEFFFNVNFTIFSDAIYCNEARAHVDHTYCKKKEISTQYDSPNTVVCSDQNVDTTNGIDISLHKVNKCKNCATLKLENRSLMHKVYAINF